MHVCTFHITASLCWIYVNVCLHNKTDGNLLKKKTVRGREKT